MKKVVLTIIVLLIIAGMITGLIFTLNNKKNVDNSVTNSKNIAYGQKISATSEPLLVHNDLKIFINSENAAISIARNNVTMLTSNPEDYQNDKIIKGINRTRILSQLLLYYVDETGQQNELNSYSSCVSNGWYSIFKDKDAVVVVYDFRDEGFTVPVRYSLIDTGIVAGIEVDKIVESKKNRLLQISLLPFMGASGIKDNGYIFVPDGSGAIINFNNGKAGSGEVLLNVYGSDSAKKMESKRAKMQPCLIPFFGMNFMDSDNKPLHGFYALATSGEAGSTISALTSGVQSSYNTCRFNFTFRTSDQIVKLDRTWAANTVLVSSKRREVQNFEVRYCLLDADESTLAGMARKYRDYLITKGMKPTDTKLSLFMDVTAGIKDKKQIAGIVYEDIKPLTSVNELSKIIGYFEKNIKSMEIMYKGFNANGAFYNKIDTKMQLDSSLGRLKDFNSLYTKSKNVQIYPEFEVMEFIRSGNGISVSRDTALGLSNKKIKISDFLYSTGDKNARIPSRYLIVPDRMHWISKGIVKSLDSNNINNFGISTGVQAIYSSQGSNIFTMNESKDAFIKSYSDISSKKKVMAQAPNGYAWPYVETFQDMPIYSSQFVLCDADVPFLQMVLHGAAKYSTPPLNYYGNYMESLLRAIESGSSPSFSFMYAPYEEISETTLYEQNASRFDTWKEAANDAYTLIESVLKDVESCTIVNYEVLAPGVKKITYSNKTYIYVNYNDKDFNFENIVIPAMGYSKSNY